MSSGGDKGALYTLVKGDLLLLLLLELEKNWRFKHKNDKYHFYALRAHLFYFSVHLNVLFPTFPKNVRCLNCHQIIRRIKHNIGVSFTELIISYGNWQIVVRSCACTNTTITYTDHPEHDSRKSETTSNCRPLGLLHKHDKSSMIGLKFSCSRGHTNTKLNLFSKTFIYFKLNFVGGGKHTGILIFGW